MTRGLDPRVAHPSRQFEKVQSDRSADTSAPDKFPAIVGTGEKTFGDLSFADRIRPGLRLQTSKASAVALYAGRGPRSVNRIYGIHGPRLGGSLSADGWRIRLLTYIRPFDGPNALCLAVGDGFRVKQEFTSSSQSLVTMTAITQLLRKCSRTHAVGS
jgi:hypothetical protein